MTSSEFLEWLFDWAIVGFVAAGLLYVVGGTVILVVRALIKMVWE